MRVSKLLTTLTAAAAMIAIGVAGAPPQANAHAGYRSGDGVGVVIGVPGQVPQVGYYAPPAIGYYAPPQTFYVPPSRCGCRRNPDLIVIPLRPWPPPNLLPVGFRQAEREISMDIDHAGGR